MAPRGFEFIRAAGGSDSYSTGRQGNDSRCALGRNFSVTGLAGIRFSPDGTGVATSGYFAFEGTGGWEQFGYLRFWRVADGALRRQFDQHTGIGVPSAIAWSPDAAQFIYGTYEGTVVAARTPAP